MYHEFNDGILPLFVTAHHLRRRVVLVILEYHDWSTSPPTAVCQCALLPRADRGPGEYLSDRDSVELGLESNRPSASLYRGLRGEISVRDGACNRSWRAWQDGEISSSAPFHFLAFYF